jgi:hypothetical protein
MLASVFILIPFRQDEQQGLSHRDGSTAFGAIELHGFKFIKIGLISGGWPPCRWDEVKRSFFHDENPWISTIECGIETLTSKYNVPCHLRQVP